MRAVRRLAKVAEALAERGRDENRPRVVVYLPRKDGDTRPAGPVSTSGGALLVLCDPGHPDPELPHGW